MLPDGPAQTLPGKHLWQESLVRERVERCVCVETGEARVRVRMGRRVAMARRARQVVKVREEEYMDGLKVDEEESVEME